MASAVDLTDHQGMLPDLQCGIDPVNIGEAYRWSGHHRPARAVVKTSKTTFEPIIQTAETFVSHATTVEDG